MAAQRIGRDTLLSQIVQMVAEASRSRAPIQRPVDVVAAYFVPAMVVGAVMPFIAWALFGPQPSMAYASINAVAVLIIACLCALSLATPISIMVASSRGPRPAYCSKMPKLLRPAPDRHTGGGDRGACYVIQLRLDGEQCLTVAAGEGVMHS